MKLSLAFSVIEVTLSGDDFLKKWREREKKERKRESECVCVSVCERDSLSLGVFLDHEIIAFFPFKCRAIEVCCHSKKGYDKTSDNTHFSLGQCVSLTFSKSGVFLGK